MYVCPARAHNRIANSTGCTRKRSSRDFNISQFAAKHGSDIRRCDSRRRIWEKGRDKMTRNHGHIIPYSHSRSRGIHTPHMSHTDWRQVRVRTYAYRRGPAACACVGGTKSKKKKERERRWRRRRTGGGTPPESLFGRRIWWLVALCSASCYAPRAPPDHKRGYFAPAQQPPRFSLYQRIGVGQIKFARENGFLRHALARRREMREWDVEIFLSNAILFLPLLLEYHDN